MKSIKICTLAAVTVMALGLSGTARTAQAYEMSVTGIELGAQLEMAPLKKCIKKPKRVPGTGGPAQLPPGYRWC